ncbi:centrosomal protein of 70 kDa [Hypomesus transpacificus]|uniref:centrosomal protein of 70 kDa n=1 Tax=Hypomesus transpacificus TaxID=137520 RepID=UPI001F08454D|nr:centrosomal protein of 70 kDa [Hypomesus transpacificus]
MDKLEQTEWDSVNKLLQHHGFKPVHFADPIENKNLSDLVLLEKRSAGDIRTMLRTMLTDSERRQALIQELIQSNSQLKEEAQQHLSRAGRQSQRAAELEGVLAGVKGKVQHLEDSYISKAAQQHGLVHQLQQDKKDMQKQHQAREQKLSEEKAVASQLQRKLYFAVKEEEGRIARQNQVFQQIHERSARPHSPVDQQILDVIDVYEAQMQQLRDELRAFKRERDSDESLQSSDQSQSRNGTPVVFLSNHKSLIKSYQEQLKEIKAQREELKNQIQQLKQDLESRPTVKELKAYKHQLRRMDRIIKQNNTRSAEGSKEQDSAETSILEGSTTQASEASDARRYLKMLGDISEVVSGPGAPLRLLRQRPNESSEMLVFNRLLPTLQMWAEQLGSLKDLHRTLNKLIQRLQPWQSASSNDSVPSASVRVEDLMLLVETLLEETVNGEEKVLRSPTKNTLQSMVAHFQKLFDAPSLSGVYPRMNEVYTRLGEMTNAMKNLRDVLALDDRAPPSEVVNQVARMVSSPEDCADNQLHNLLGTSDIESIISKVKEHEEFFPAFYSLVIELLQTLDVQHLDDIIPALRSLKSRAL